MGIRDFFNSTTETVKRNTPDVTPVKNACRTSYNYGSAALTKIDNVVRVNGLQMLNQWLPDDETKSKIGTFAAKLATNAGLYALQEGYKLVPGGVAVSNIVSMTIKEVKHETSNDIPKLLEERVGTPGKQFTGATKLVDRAEMQLGSLDRVNVPGARKLVDRAEMQLGSLDRINVDSIDNQKPEDVIRIFMMKEFFASFFEDLMVPKMRRGKKPE
ncbi:Uncharacterized protein Adt_36877 [Abeliophyllum distichum]|uniref:Uncharacterized protein n=1 Tax=Abeliophyllum distichum TaxID=126358 RepID=A0ABD1QMH0_9LAMI